ncbi:MAG: ABC transporter permease [Clostridia bacterium]|nr:ABC transporter permease [Clostridia bacterium]
MKRIVYIFLQLKRFVRALPAVLALSLVLFCCIYIAFNAVMQKEAESKAKFEVAIVGDPSDSYLELGVVALKNFDTSRFSINVVYMEESEARKKLEAGALSAYVVIPEGFLLNAYYGDIGKLTYVSSPGAIGLTTIIKDEILEVISIILVASQKGIYAAGNVADEMTKDISYGEAANDSSFEFIDLILSRSKMYRMELLGPIGGISFGASVFCGVLIFFLLFMCIGFAPVFAKKEHSLGIMLASKRFGAVPQIIGEYIPFAFVGSISVLAFVYLLKRFLGEELNMIIGQNLHTSFVLRVIISFLMLAAMQFLIYEITEGITASVLAQFLAAVGLAYFSGCLYPIYFFPQAVQRAADYLPTGVIRVFLNKTLTGEDAIEQLKIIIIYLVVFLAAAAVLRYMKIKKAKGDAI